MRDSKDGSGVLPERHTPETCSASEKDSANRMTVVVRYRKETFFFRTCDTKVYLSIKLARLAHLASSHVPHLPRLDLPFGRLLSLGSPDRSASPSIMPSQYVSFSQIRPPVCLKSLPVSLRIRGVDPLRKTTIESPGSISRGQVPMYPVPSSKVSVHYFWSSSWCMH